MSRIEPDGSADARSWSIGNSSSSTNTVCADPSANAGGGNRVDDDVNKLGRGRSASALTPGTSKIRQRRNVTIIPC